MIYTFFSLRFFHLSYARTAVAVPGRGGGAGDFCGRRGMGAGRLQPGDGQSQGDGCILYGGTDLREGSPKERMQDGRERA